VLEASHQLPTPPLTDFQTLRRMLGWGIVMAMLWGLLPFLCGSWLGLLFLWSPEKDLSPPKAQSQIEMEDGFGAVFFWGFFVLMFYDSRWGGGHPGRILCTGARIEMAGCSKFFWRLGTQIFCRWFITNFILFIFGPVLWTIVAPPIDIDWRMSLIMTCSVLVLSFAACAQTSVGLLLHTSKE
jgi:hypothetical protein